MADLQRNKVIAANVNGTQSKMCLSRTAISLRRPGETYLRELHRSLVAKAIIPVDKIGDCMLVPAADGS
jgi:hypothetical protein